MKRIFTLIITLMALTACTAVPQTQVAPEPAAIDTPQAGMPNPASVYCTQNGTPSAGFGKTTLVSEWVAGCGQSVAWLSLDAGDNDPIRFLTYLVAALQTLVADIGAGVSDGLQSPQPPPIESTLTALINEIAAIPDNFVLVLDDYHVIDAKPIEQALTFLLEHLPPQMHLVIATREDPNLPLARLRVRGHLTELRAADLRFTPAEAAEFLNQVMGLKAVEPARVGNITTDHPGTLEPGDRRAAVPGPGHGQRAQPPDL